MQNRRRLVFRVLGMSFAVAVAVGMAAPRAAEAQRRPMSQAQREAAAKRFKSGQVVEVERFRKWEPAEVVSVDGVFVRVKLLAPEHDGWEIPTTPDSIRVVSAAREAGIKKALKAAEEKAAEDAKKAEAGKAAGDKPAGGKPGAPGAVAAPAIPLTDVLLADVAAQAPDAHAAWAYKPVPATAPAAKAPAGKSVPLHSPFPKDERGRRSIFEKPEGIVVPSDAASRVVGVVWTGGGPGTSTDRRVQVVDVVAGNVLFQVPLPTDTTLRDLSTNGRRMLLQGAGWAGANAEQLHVYDVVDGKSLKHVVSFAPYPKGPSASRGNELTFLSFLDNDRVLTCGVGGKLALWNIATPQKPKPAYVIELGAGDVWYVPSPRLNPQRTAVAVRQTKGPLFLFDAKSGQTLCKVEGAVEDPHVIARSGGSGALAPVFDPAGTRLAAPGGKGLRVWDLAAGGKLTHDLTLQLGVNATGGVRLLDGPLALLGGTDLLDLTKGIVIWEYDTGRQPSAMLSGGRIALLGDSPAPAAAGANRAKAVRRGVGGNEPKRLTTVALPHDAAKKRAAAIKPGSFLAVQPGMTASIEVSFTAGGGPPDIQERAVKRVTEQLRANGINVVAEPQPLRAVITSVPGETKSERYASGLGAFAKELGSASMQAVTHSVTLTLDGTPAWRETGGASLPGSVMVKQGQTPQQYVDELRASSFSFFDTVALPAEVLKPKELLRPGTSKIDAGGLTDGPLPPLPEPAPVAAGGGARAPNPTAKPGGDGF